MSMHELQPISAIISYLWNTHHLRFSAIPLLYIGLQIAKTHFADRAFRCSAPAVWSSLNTDTFVCSNSLALFQRFCFSFVKHLDLYNTTVTVLPALVNSIDTLALYKFIYYYYYYYYYCIIS